MSDIQRYEAVSVWSITKDDAGSYVNYDDHAAIVAQLKERNSGLEAARIAYASEFPLSSEGEPDVGSIHQNIRKLKADYAQLEADLAESQKVIKVVDGLVTAKGRYHTAQWYQKMVTVIDEYKAAIKEQQ